jgi:hypothetical protein
LILAERFGTGAGLLCCTLLVLWQPANVALAITATAWANRVNASELKVLRIDDDIGWGIVPVENVGRF